MLIPKWVYLSMFHNRVNSCTGKDEHGRAVEEQPYVPTGLAFPGYGDGRVVAQEEKGLVREVEGK